MARLPNWPLKSSRQTTGVRRNRRPQEPLRVSDQLPIIASMEQVLVRLDQETSRLLEKIAPKRSRKRAEFIRMAIRKALWEQEERATARAYRLEPDRDEPAFVDARVWEEPRPYRRKR